MPLPYWERFMPLHHKGVDSSKVILLTYIYVFRDWNSCMIAACVNLSRYCVKVSGTSSLPQNATTPAKNSHTLNPLKQNKQREGARWIRSTQLDEDARQNQLNIDGALEVKVHIEKQERRTRNKDRPDRGVWAPFLRSDGSHASDESLSSNTYQTTQLVDSTEGSYRKGGRRGSAYNIKDIDGSSVVERKFSKRGGSSGYASHEKQVWIQKSSLGP
ncbi:uncharacterized protein [Primulina eburnea]|uniref:uncharacterized protein n=1 Tax=Primulina eburnea TaxID=1245227 RepID=UPI003C6C589D